jgi:hypothetical protein
MSPRAPTASATVVRSLGSLLRIGTCPTGAPGLDSLLIGLAHLGRDGGPWVMSRRLLGVRAQLATDEEAIAAILAQDEALCADWARILAARCREAAEWQDGGALVQLVTRLGGAAAWVEAALSEPSLAPTATPELERELLGASAEQAHATPALVRALAAASRLCAWREAPLPALAPLDPTGERVDDNWCAGRLLAAPDAPERDPGFE